MIFLHGFVALYQFLLIGIYMVQHSNLNTAGVGAKVKVNIYKTSIITNEFTIRDLSTSSTTHQCFS